MGLPASNSGIGFPRNSGSGLAVLYKKSTPTMDTPLTPKIEQLIRERLQTGSYQSATDVLEDALDALVERENFEAIRAELRHADEQLAHGEYTEYDESTIQKLAEEVKTRARAHLTEDRHSGTQ